MHVIVPMYMMSWSNTLVL